ncbi:hypothetical protein BD413DRAFT_579667, partial [Trametes elegans]
MGYARRLTTHMTESDEKVGLQPSRQHTLRIALPRLLVMSLPLPLRPVLLLGLPLLLVLSPGFLPSSPLFLGLSCSFLIHRSLGILLGLSLGLLLGLPRGRPLGLLPELPRLLTSLLALLLFRQELVQP